MNNLFSDLRYSLRMMRKNPGVSALAIGALALGIGANTAVFSVVYGVMLKPLPYADPDRIVYLTERKDTNPSFSVSPKNYLDWRASNTVFSDVAAVVTNTYNLTGFEEPERLVAATATASLASILGVQPALGRFFTEAEDRPEGDRVVVLSAEFWQRRFNRDAGVLGRSVMLNGNPHTIIGVMPEGFSFPEPEVSFWTPLQRIISPQGMQARGAHYLDVIARLKPGVTVGRAESEMSAIAAAIAKQDTRSSMGTAVNVVTLADAMTRKVRQPLFVLLGAVGLVMLIACANAANLLLSGASGRVREMAVRSALGASRRRLIRQLLIESLLLATIAGATGVLLATWSIEPLMALAGDAVPTASAVSMNIPVLLFALLMSTGTGVVFGLIPALVASRGDVNELLRGVMRGSIGDKGSNRFRSALVACEVAIAVVLMVGAGLLGQSFLHLRGVSLGFNPHELRMFRVSLPEAKYAEPQQVAAFMERVVSEMSRAPGVRAASGNTHAPMTGPMFDNSFLIVGKPEPPREHRNFALIRFPMPDWFEMMGIRLVRGRYFTPHDRIGSKEVAVISETMARRYFPGEDPIGQTLHIQMMRPHIKAEIVGVVGDVRTDPESEFAPAMYVPALQRPRNHMYLFARGSGMTAEVARSIVRSVDPTIPVYAFTTGDRLVASRSKSPQFHMTLIGLLAFMALSLSLLGLYGVLSRLVSERTAEIGVRMALGAEPGRVLRMFLSKAMVLLTVGLVAGMAASLALAQVLRSQLHGVTPADPSTYLSVAALMLAVALVAAYVPSKRATSIDPADALRQQ